MKVIRRLFNCFLALAVMAAAFNVSTIRTEAVSKNSKIYKVMLRERKLFKEEAECYGYVFTKDEFYMKTDYDIRWGFEVWNCDPDLDLDDDYFTEVCLNVEDTGEKFDIGYSLYLSPEASGTWTRDLMMNRLKKYALSSSIQDTLKKKSAKKARSLLRELNIPSDETPEITSEYVKSSKAGRAKFTAINSEGKEYKIVIKTLRKKRKIYDIDYGYQVMHPFIATKYYLNGAPSTKEEILKKFE